MRSFIRKTTTIAAIPFALAQDNNITYVPTTCNDTYMAGTDEVLFTVPYTYDQVMSIIGNYSNLTWSGSPEGSVKLNGSDNTVGTARTYEVQGIKLIETILNYSKPDAPGPYDEVHNTALFNVPMPNVSLYIPYDGTIVSSVCNGKASMFNFTANFCATNTTLAQGVLHQLHLMDAQTVGKFLGGDNYTDCKALGEDNANGPSNDTAATTTTANSEKASTSSSSSATPSASKSAVDGLKYNSGLVGGIAAIMAAMVIL